MHYVGVVAEVHAGRGQRAHPVHRGVPGVLVCGLAGGKPTGLRPVLAGRVGSIADQQVRAAVLGGDQYRLVAGGVAGGGDDRQAGPDLGVAVQLLEAGVLEVEPVIEGG